MTESHEHMDTLFSRLLDVLEANARWARSGEARDHHTATWSASPTCRIRR